MLGPILVGAIYFLVSGVAWTGDSSPIDTGPLNMGIFQASLTSMTALEQDIGKHTAPPCA